MTVGINELIEQVIGEVERADERRGRGDQGSGPATLGLTEPVESSGTAYDERITITITDGRVTGCELQPHVLRLGHVELGEQLMTAMNAALSAYQADLTAALADQQADLSGMTSSLRAIQADAVRTVSGYTEQMYELLKRGADR